MTCREDGDSKGSSKDTVCTICKTSVVVILPLTYLGGEEDRDEVDCGVRRYGEHWVWGHSVTQRSRGASIVTVAF